MIYHTKKGDIDLAHATEAELQDVRPNLQMAFREGGVALHELAGKPCACSAQT